MTHSTTISHQSGGGKESPFDGLASESQLTHVTHARDHTRTRTPSTMNGSAASTSASAHASTSMTNGGGGHQIKPEEYVHNPAIRVVGPDEAPLWRITAAMDPNTTPLTLMSVWALRIDPRKTDNYMRFSRSIARRLRAAEQGGDLDGRGSMNLHGNGKGGRKNGYTQDDEADEDEEEEEDEESEESEESEDEDESMRHLRLFQRCEDGRSLNALVCRVQDMPTYDRVVALLKTADLVPDGTEPEPFEVQVPRNPAPSRNRLPEWKAFWPVSVKYGKVINTLVKPSLSGSNAPVTSGTSPGVVDRAADARLWNGMARTWAIQNFQKCLRAAWEAGRQGELPIGVHVTSTYPEGDVILSGVADGQAAIEVDASDTRRSERNPIKHSVTNAIRDVAKIRSERDWERLLVLNSKVANLYRDPHADPNIQRQAVHKAEIAAAAAAAAAAAENDDGSGSSSPSSSTNASTPKMSNGQDYLLNNLTLFITHEPCVSCCMALVHSRVRAIFFIQPSPRAGGCCGAGLEESRRCAYAQDGGPYAVQEQAGLNHKFDVWRWVGDDADLLPTDELGRSDEQHAARQVRLDVLGLDI